MKININDLLFLSKGYCYSCKDELYKNKYLCEDCLNLLDYIDGEKNIGEYICYFPYLYSGRIKELIHEFKFNNASYLFRALGELLVDYILSKQIDFNCILPVPMTRKKWSNRGYNQSELLANYIGRKLEVEVCTDVLIKKKDSKDQHLLSLEDRRKNLEDCFKLQNTRKLHNRDILLLDDIVTSGYTLKENINVIEKANINSLKGLVIASSKIESKFKNSFKNI